MKFIGLIRTAYGLFVKLASLLQSPLLLVIRLYWGYEFILTGWGKLTDLGKVTGYFTDLGLPFPGVNAFLAGATECFGGALLLAGLASRAAALGLSFTMVIAYLTAEKDALHALFKDPDTFTGAAPFLFLYAAVIVLAFGPGVFSVDYILGRKWGKRAAPPAE